MSASARSSLAAAVSARTGSLAPLWTILGIGLLLRLLFIGSEGFHNDVAAFESWTLTLRDNPPWAFYGKASFADYPPGYFAVLWLLGHLYSLIPGASADGLHGWSILRDVVKLPAIAMDLVDAALVYAIARRYAAHSVALLAAAVLAFNPAAIYVSAYWGQVDSVSWGFVLLALLLVLRAGDDPERTAGRLTLAWLAFAFSLLIKPQGAAVGLLFLAYPFATSDPALRARRLRGTGAGIAAGLALAWAIGGVFHGTANPLAVFGWLLHQYAFGSNVYPYNTINAFNLYAIRQPMWQPDTVVQHVFGVAVGPLSAWGVVLVVASAGLVVGRYLQRRDDRALIEGAMLLAFTFFVLATRMHERYVYGAFLLAMPLIAFGRTGLWSAITLTVTLFLNLAYSFAYQAAMEAHTPGVDATNLWPAISHPAALANVVLFFVLGWRYLGMQTDVPSIPSSAGEELRAAFGSAVAKARTWFDPREGLAAMTRADWLLAGGFTLVSFVLCLLWVQYPADRYFDEVYYPRAGEEYLKHLNVSGWGPFEFTHPPFTKLLIAASMLLFGGLHGLGDTGIGWRFLNVVVGALTVGLIYVFAKRLTASTPFASVAALLLLTDGFHFAQSRIATPEITVAFFALLTLYAFYRLWLAAQIARAPLAVASEARRGYGFTMGAGAVLAAIVAWLVPGHSGPIVNGAAFVGWAQAVAAFYVLLVAWLLARCVVVPRMRRRAMQTSYADGTRIVTDGKAVRALDPGGNAMSLGATQRDGEAVRTLERDGTLVYETPAGNATYGPDGTAVAGPATVRWTDARIWWVVLAFSGALLADSKWNGLLDFLVVWTIAAAVGAQRWLRKPARFGNPFGMPIDVVVASMLVAGGAIYTLSYIPYFTLGRGFVDMIAMQEAMYHYHATLVATHPYASYWWQWPLLLKPIVYYWNDARTGLAAQDGNACCVAEIIGLPNPFTWWLGIATVPIVGWLAWRERNKGYALLAIAYLWQWLPWARSPRLEFEYHFYPNDAIIMLADAIVLQRIWNWRPNGQPSSPLPRYAVGAFLAVTVIAFIYFYPVLAAMHITWNQWHERMWLQHWVI